MFSSQRHERTYREHGLLFISLAFVAWVPLGAGLIPVDPHNIARILQLGLLALAGLVLVSRGELDWPCLESWPSFLAVGAVVASVLAAPKVDLAARECALMVSLGVLAFVLRAVAWTSTVQIFLVLGLTAYAVVVSFVLIGAVLIAQNVDYTYLALGYSNIRFLNHAQSVSTPLLVACICSPELSRRYKWLARYALVFAIAMTSLLQARATTVAFIAICAAAPLLFGHCGRAFSRQLTWAAIVGVLLHGFVMVVLPWLVGIDLPGYRPYAEASSIEARLFLLRTAWADVASHPWFGVGPMHFAHYFNGEAAHPHNIYAQVAAEYGLPLALLLFVWVASAMWRAARTIRTKLPNDMLAVGSYLAVLASLVDGCFSGNFVMPMSQMWIVLAVALLLSRLQTVVPTRKLEGSITINSWVIRGSFVALLVGQLWLISVSWPEWRMVNPVLITDDPPIHSEYYSPRFWRDGWF